VDGDEVGAGADLFERREFDAGVAQLFGRDERVEGDDVHLEAARAARHHAADASQTDDAERLPAQLDADEFLPLPASGLEARVPLRDAAREREQKRERVFGGRHRVAVGRVHHDDAALRRRPDVNVVHADARAADGAQRPGRFEQLRRDLRLAAHDEPLAVAHGLEQFLALQARPLLDREARRTQRFEPALTHVVRNKYFCVIHEAVDYSDSPAASPAG